MVVSCGEDDPAPAAEDTGPPAVQRIGRWDESGSKPTAAWPGSRVVARFDGTGVTFTVSHSNPSGSPSGTTWLNVLVDGTLSKKVEVTGASQPIEVGGLTAGTHTVMLEKRTEPFLGVLALDDTTFANGGKLLPPPPRPKRRIEFVSDSTIDGFGADGDVKQCPQADAEFDDVRKSLAHFVSDGLSAEPHVIAYSGRGIVRNEGDEKVDLYPKVYERILPDSPSSQWDFTKWTPDVVIIALGGSDITSTTPPKGFQEGYDALVTSIRGRHPNAHIFMTVWSQIKDLTRPAGFAARSTLKGVLDAIKSAHASDARLHVFQWREADYPEDETGCAEHANEAHGKETAAEIIPVIKSKAGW